MALFFNHNLDPVHLTTPYSHNSGLIVPGIKSTGAQEPGASTSVFESWLGPFSWDEIGLQQGFLKVPERLRFIFALSLLTVAIGPLQTLQRKSFV